MAAQHKAKTTAMMATRGGPGLADGSKAFRSRGNWTRPIEAEMLQRGTSHAIWPRRRQRFAIECSIAATRNAAGHSARKALKRTTNTSAAVCMAQRST